MDIELQWWIHEFGNLSGYTSHCSIPLSFSFGGNSGYFLMPSKNPAGIVVWKQNRGLNILSVITGSIIETRVASIG